MEGLPCNDNNNFVFVPHLHIRRESRIGERVWWLFLPLKFNYTV